MGERTRQRRHTEPIRLWGCCGILVVLAAACVGQREDGGSPQERACQRTQNQDQYRSCQTAAECPEPLTICQMAEEGPTGLCTQACTKGEDCQTDAVCYENEDLGIPLSCVLSCTDSACCPPGLICLQDPADPEVSFCAPEAWAQGETPCTEGETQCQAMSLLTCQEGQWQETSCDDICQEKDQGLATKCTTDDTSGQVRCFCKGEQTAPDLCQPGEIQCDGLELRACVGGFWSSQSCTEVCQAQEAAAESCQDQACVCQSTETCEDGATRCVSSTLQSCQESTWNSQSCQAYCQALGFDETTGCSGDTTCGCQDTPAPLKGWGAGCRVGLLQCESDLECVRLSPTSDQGYCSKTCSGIWTPCNSTPGQSQAVCLLASDDGQDFLCTFICKIQGAGGPTTYPCPESLACAADEYYEDSGIWLCVP